MTGRFGLGISYRSLSPRESVGRTRSALNFAMEHWGAFTPTSLARSSRYVVDNTAGLTIMVRHIMETRKTKHD